MLTALSDLLRQKGFKKTSKLFGITVSIGFASFLVIALLLIVYGLTGTMYGKRLGIFCAKAMTVSCGMALLVQSTSQVIRFVCRFIAKFKGTKPPVFQEEDPAYAKVIKKAFKAVRAKYEDNRRSFAMAHKTRNNRAPIHMIMNHSRSCARAYRSASRPSFAHAASSSGGNSGDSGSGDSDSSDPPAYHHKLTPRNSSSKPNRQHHTWRNFPGSWRIAMQRRRFA